VTRPRTPPERRFRIERLRDGRWSFLASVTAPSLEAAKATVSRYSGVPMDHLRLERKP
jgi:hypothetical protein